MREDKCQTDLRTVLLKMVKFGCLSKTRSGFVSAMVIHCGCFLTKKKSLKSQGKKNVFKWMKLHIKCNVFK